MKKFIIPLLICLVILSGCGAKSAEEVTEPAGQLQLGNPWKSYDTLADAETACALAFPIPAGIPEGYTAECYRVLNGSLLEVQYRKDGTEITIRVQPGEEADISGVYENFTQTETFDRNGASVTRKQAENCLVYLVCGNGYSFSIYASDPAADDICIELLSHIC